MSQENQPLDLQSIVNQAAAEPGKVNMPIAEETAPVRTSSAITEEELAVKKAQNVFKPNTGEVEQAGERGLSPDESKDAIVETIDEMVEDWNDSYEVRKQFRERGVNTHLTGDVDAEHEAGATSEEREAARKQREENEKNLTEEQQAEQLEEEFNEKMLVINKMGPGYLNFTKEEEEKIEKVDVIRLNEVKVVDINSLKTRKKRKYSPDKAISMTKKAFTIEVPLPVSGFIVSMRGLSTQEMQNLWAEADDNVIRRESTKWRILYDCVVDSSIGKLTYAEFRKEVGSADFETLVFGALSATYPEDDSIEIQCVNQKCGKSFDHEYSLRSLIRAERFTDEMTARLANIIEAAGSKEAALAVHEESPVRTVESFILPESGYVLTTYTQSAQDLIEISYKQLAEIEDPAYSQAAILTSAVKEILVPDPEEEGIYDSYDDAEDIIKFIYSLRDKDLLILTKKIEEVLTDKSIQYGFMNVTCPHCGKYSKTLAVNLSEILFHHSQRYNQTDVQ